MKRLTLILATVLAALGIVSGLSAQDYYKAALSTIVTVTGLGTTSTDGFTLQNTTPATVGTPVQLSPREKWCGTAYNSVSTLSETDCFFIETLPATTAGTTTATFRVGYINNAGSITYPLTMTSPGNLALTGNVTGGTFDTTILSFNSATHSRIYSPVDGQIVLMNAAQTFGSTVKTDALPTFTGFGTSPTVTAGSTAYAGSINVGTGGTATTGVITFNGTAFPSAPFCTYSTQTSNVVTRGTPTTTQVTLNTTTAWTASDVVTWHCISAK